METTVKLLREYIQESILIEGLAGFGNRIFMNKIVKAIENNEYSAIKYQDSRHNQWRDGFGFIINKSVFEKMWNDQNPEFHKFLVDKFSTEEFFVRNLSRLKWFVVLQYNNTRAVGMASNAVGWDGGYRNTKTGEELYDGDESPDVEAIHTFQAISRMSKKEKSKAGWIEVNRQGLSKPTEKSILPGVGQGYISCKVFNAQTYRELKTAHVNKTGGKSLSIWMKSVMDNVSSENLGTWVHELQHWIQYLSYATSTVDKKQSVTDEKYANAPGHKNHTPVGPHSLKVISYVLKNLGTKFETNNIKTINGKNIVPIKKGSLTAKGLKVMLRDLWCYGEAITEALQALANIKEDPSSDSKDLFASIYRVHQPNIASFSEPVPWNSKDSAFLNLRLFSILAYKHMSFTHKWRPIVYGLLDENHKQLKLKPSSLKKACYIEISHFSKGTEASLRGQSRRARMPISRYQKYNDQKTVGKGGWEDSILELDAERAAALSKIWAKMLASSSRDFSRMVIMCFNSDYENLYNSMKARVRIELMRFLSRKDMMDREMSSIENIAVKFADYLIECAERVEAENYITEEQWGELLNSNVFDRIKLLKSSGWLDAWTKEVDQKK